MAHTQPSRPTRLMMLLSVVAGVILFLGYQITLPVTVHIGAAGDHHYLSGFYYPEQIGQDTFRWTARRAEIVFPGLGSSAPVRLQIALQGWRPESTASPVVTLTVNGQFLTTFTPGATLSAHEFDIPPELTRVSPDLAIGLQSSNTFVPRDTLDSQDERKLGLLVASVQAQQVGGWVLPPFMPFALVWIAVIGIMALASQISARPGAAFTASLCALAVAIYFIGGHRLETARLAWAPCTIILVLNGITAAVHWAKEGERHIALDERAALIAMLLALGAVRYFQQAIFAPRDVPPVDFAVDYVGATVVQRGQMLYDLSALRQAHDQVIVPRIVALHETIYNSFDNPPFTAILIMPFTHWPFPQAKNIYRLMLHALYFSIVALVLSADRSYQSYPQWAFIVMLALSLEPAYTSFMSGQVDIPIMVGIYLGYWAFKHGRPVLAGCAIAFAAMIKLSPALLLIYFLYKRQFKVVLAGAATMALLLGLGIAVTGPDDWLVFVRDILPVLGRGSTQFENQTITGFLYGLFVTPLALFSLQPMPPLVIPRVLTWTSQAAICLLMLRLYWSQNFGALDKGLHFDLEFSLGIVALLIASTVAWQHYYVWLLLPLATLLRPDIRHWLTSREYTFGAAAFGLSVGLILFPISIFFLWPVEYYNAHWEMRLLFWAKLYGALILFGLLVALLWRVRRGCSHTNRLATSTSA